ncbi:serine/threonine-protein kinase [Mycolicibacterium vaccae]|uniref:non-specific serine/threonine protein kinase n=1 Tax=Mycolicibacterium vaccae ATCC 25954 TaxID=1194972 RepID=K0V6G0_MYCVA|nr:serine/threonine-protein kinase [Mycolicibacterium vaccae]ANI42966.1 serine/threonine protein kinase [Mycolicibacterium vaccae 95051]EJZ06624.1 protein kinase family protein [Mycolicibacterium vaccae ATCC 25954]
MPIAEGAVFAGYTIQRLLGSGGMGEVYLVQHPRLPRQEALKILPANISADPDYRQRFAREADIAASLWHPHIVSIHDRGEHDGQLWITMDYVEGTDAARLVRERYPHGMPPKEVLGVVAAIADALDYAHERFLLHRDVKPANILLSDPRKGEHRIVLADFGIARGVDDSNGLTATNMTVGSVAYAAPEQLTGKVLDGRADQYALAAAAFHLLTGTVPFGNSNPAVVIGNHLSSPPPTLSKLRDDLGQMDSALATAMAKEPHHRFQTCHEFAAALAGRDTAPIGGGAAYAVGPYDATQLAPRPSPITSGVPTQQRLVTAPPPEPGRGGNRKALIAGGVAVALLAVGLIAFVGAKLGQSPAASPSAAPTPTLTRPVWPETVEPPRTITRTAPPVTVTQPGVPPPAAPAPPRAPAPAPRVPSAPMGDLGLGQPMSKPSCNGQGIVVLGSVTTPGQYAAGVQRLLAAHPGASYLRTDQACPSLRAATDEGNPIYAVYRPAGDTQAEVCAAVRSAGGDAYGKWLDYTTAPSFRIPC